MKLYQHPLSTFARRVRMQLIEKSVTLEEQIVDMENGEHRSEAYRRLNPYGRVPTLTDGDFVLYESSAIMDYVERLHPTPPLLPSDSQARARVAMHVKLCDLQVGVYTPTLFFPRRFFPRERWNLAAQDQARDAISLHLDIVSQQLGNRPYLVGDTFTLADLAYCILTPFLDLFELRPQENVLAWMERIESRPSARQTRPSR